MNAEHKKLLRMADDAHKTGGMINGRTEDQLRLAAAACLVDKEEVLSALIRINCHYNDLSKSNPGFMGAMVLQDYGLWNDGLLMTERVLSKAGLDARATSLKDTIKLSQKL